MYDFLYQTFKIFSIDILLKKKKKIEACWSRDITDEWVLAHFDFKILYDFQAISNLVC